MAQLIIDGDIKARIDSYDKILHTMDDNFALKSFEKSLEAGSQFLKNIEILLNKYHVDQYNK